MKVIIVPKDKNAEDDLEYDQAKDDQLLKLVLKQDEFDKLFKEGIFELINSIAHVNIDDFENEKVTTEKQLSAVVAELGRRRVTENLKSKTEEIIVLFNEAINRNTSVHFYF